MGFPAQPAADEPPIRVLVCLLQSATDIDGAHVPMSRYAGRLVVVANVASEDHVRGYTLQVRWPAAGLLALVLETF